MTGKRRTRNVWAVTPRQLPAPRPPLASGARDARQRDCGPSLALVGEDPGGLLGQDERSRLSGRYESSGPVSNVIKILVYVFPSLFSSFSSFFFFGGGHCYVLLFVIRVFVLVFIIIRLFFHFLFLIPRRRRGAWT